MTIQYQGVWTLAQQAQLQSTQQWVTDPLYKNTTLLLQADDAANAAQNNTFLDSSPNSFIMTRNGGAPGMTQGSLSPFSVATDAWSYYFNGLQRLDFPVTAPYQLGSSNFTYETWVYATVAGDNQTIYWNANASGYAALGVRISSAAGNPVRLSLSTNGSTWATDTNYGSTIPNTWNHIAVVRNGTNVRLYLNGRDITAGGVTITGSLMTTYTLNQLAAYNTSSFRLTGYLSNTRLVIGSALYTSNFTPSTSPLTTTSQGATASEVEILTCQNSRFVDNSSNAAVITIDGAPTTVPFSPFAPQSQYLPGTSSGSGFFDGTVDFVRVTASASQLISGTGDWEIQAWVYPLNFNGPQYSNPIICIGNGNTEDLMLRANVTALATDPTISINIYAISSSNTVILGSPGTSSAAAVMRINQWSHVAFNRIGGVFNVWVNGTRVINVTTQTTAIIRTTGTVMDIGRSPSGAPIGLWNGYISNVKITNGTTTFSGATITVPTAPVTPAGSAFCGLFNNAGIYDGTLKGVVETVGDTKISTSVVKYGSGSISFDGTGDYLSIPHTVNQMFRTGPFTIELWAYRNASGTYGLVGKGTGTTGWLVSLNSSNQVVFTYGSTTLTSSGVVAANTWTHIAVVREGIGSNQTRIYINGMNDGQATVTTDFSQTNVIFVGADRTNTSPFNGYIDDLRITQGVARYLGNFIPPSVALPRQ